MLFHTNKRVQQLLAQVENKWAFLQSFFSSSNQIRSLLSAFPPPRRKLCLRFLNGPDWGEEADWPGRGLHAQSLSHWAESQQNGPPGSRQQEAGQATEYLFSVALLRPLQTEFLLNLAPKLLGLGPCLATQREISVLRKSCPLLPSLLPPFPTLPTWFLCLKVFQNLLGLRKSRVFLKSPAWPLQTCGCPGSWELRSGRGPGRAWPPCGLPSVQACETHSRAPPRLSGWLPAGPRPRGSLGQIGALRVGEF